MDHFYKNIQGWFNFQEIYSDQINKAKDGFHFVEVGAWLGCSTAYMVVEIVNSGKQIKFDTVDTWLGTPDEIWCYENTLKENSGCVYDLFVKNMGDAIKHVNPVRMLSTEAADKYPDESLDFIFIDACHTYNCVKSDLQAWYPKLKKGGCIAGHDYDLPSVKAAVDEFFGIGKFTTPRTSWQHIKPYDLTIYTITYNENFMLPFFIKHYRTRFPNCTIVVCDNYSNDNTVSIAKSNDCIVCYYDSNDTIRDDFYINIKNNIWKDPQGIWTGNHVCQTKWCAVVDCDEFVDITSEVLNHADFNIVQTTGYDMWGEDGNLEAIDSGVLSIGYSKVCFFKPSEILEINYEIGAHRAAPKPQNNHEVKFNTTPINLHHYKYISLDYMTQRHALYCNRLSEKNKQHRWSIHYTYPSSDLYNQVKIQKKIKLK
jgi:hypothetical protein